MSRATQTWLIVGMIMTFSLTFLYLETWSPDGRPLKECERIFSIDVRCTQGIWSGKDALQSLEAVE